MEHEKNALLGHVMASADPKELTALYVYRPVDWCCAAWKRLFHRNVNARWMSAMLRDMEFQVHHVGNQRLYAFPVAAKPMPVTREADDEHLSIAEGARKRASIQAAADRFKAASRLVFASIYMPLNVSIEVSASDILAAERALQELKAAAGVA